MSINGNGKTRKAKKKVKIKSELLQKKKCLPGIKPEASIK
jgi:hypothetical protein